MNNNVSRKGLATVSDKNNGSSSVPSDKVKDVNDRYVGTESHNNHYVDDHKMDGHNVVRVAPREREFMAYEKIGSFWGKDPHYFGYRIKTLPSKYVKVRYYGIDYFRYNNVYYRLFHSHYIVCRPPFGIILDDIVTDVAFHTVLFAFYNNVYRTYSGFDSYSAYIDSQNKQIAQNNAILAQQNSQIAMNLSNANSSYDVASALGLAQSYAYADKEYYYSDGVFYIINGGKYQTIVPPAGALVEELPDDYDTITLGNTEYYRVDDTVYRLTMVDGHPYLEVLGQMYGELAEKYSLY